MCRAAGTSCHDPAPALLPRPVARCSSRSSWSIPMIAVVIVLFQLLDATDSSKLDASLSKAQTAATKLYETKREDAMVAARAVQDDVGLATAINDKDEAQVRRAPGSARAPDRREADHARGHGLRALRDRDADGDRGRVRAAPGREREGRRRDHGQHDQPPRTTRSRCGGCSMSRSGSTATARCWRRRARRSRTSGCRCEGGPTSRPAAPTTASRGSRPASPTTR